MSTSRKYRDSSGKVVYIKKSETAGDDSARTGTPVSKANIGGGSSSNVNGEISQSRAIYNTTLRSGETPFVSFPPTKLNPNGKVIIAKTSDGGYRYMGNIPDYDNIRIESDSSNYRQAQRDYNVKVSVAQGGQIIVQATGLYDRKKTFKDAEAFRKDVLNRIDSRSRFDMAELDSLKKGRISQIQAEYFRGVVRRKSSSMAIKEMNEGIRNDMQSVKERLTVAERAKSKVNQVIDNLKR